MKVRILADTVAQNAIVRVGDELNLERHEARLLIAMGKAEHAEPLDVAIEDVISSDVRVRRRARES